MEIFIDSPQIKSMVILIRKHCNKQYVFAFIDKQMEWAYLEMDTQKS